MYQVSYALEEGAYVCHGCSTSHIAQMVEQLVSTLQNHEEIIRLM